MTVPDPGIRVAFLGGINVGGHRVTAGRLRGAFEQLGHARVETFLASGNVVFAPGSDGDEAALAAAAEQALEAALGFGVPVYLRSAGEVAEIAAREPFESDLVETSGGKPQVMLLGAEPATSAAEQALALATDDDRLALDGRELHWLPEHGVGRSSLDVKALATHLGPFTVRTQNTIQRIEDKFLR